MPQAKYSAPPTPRGVTPYDWALRQLRVARAHRVTRGSRDVVVALIDIGYRHHPALNGHLWTNPAPTRGDVHGWDFADGDASLEYTGPNEDDSLYYRGHHAFVAGEIADVAPRCPIMIVRVGYGSPDSWWQGIRYAVDNGARVLVMPHGYLTGESDPGRALFYCGTDFSYPADNPGLRAAFDYAYEHNCLIVRGAADNRGRRVATFNAGHEAVLAVGSTNRRGEPADICCSTDYVEAATPGGDRQSTDERDRIWGYGGDENVIPFTGGCMASGFGGGAAALVWSRFPELTNDQVRQVLRNATRPGKGVEPNADGWEPTLGYGIVDAAKAVSVKPEQLRQDLRVKAAACRLVWSRCKPVLQVTVANRGVFDVRKAMVVAYNGNPLKAADPKAPVQAPVILLTRQIGHTIGPVRGLHRSVLDVALTERPSKRVWVQVCTLDQSGSDAVYTARIALS